MGLGLKSKGTSGSPATDDRQAIYSTRGGFAEMHLETTLRAATLFPPGCVARRLWSPLHFLLAPCQTKK